MIYRDAFDSFAEQTTFLNVDVARDHNVAFNAAADAPHRSRATSTSCGNMRKLINQRRLTINLPTCIV